MTDFVYQSLGGFSLLYQNSDQDLQDYKDERLAIDLERGRELLFGAIVNEL